MLLGNASSVAAGEYRVIATNSDGCSDTAGITVSYAPKPDLGADISRSKCPGFSYNLQLIYNEAGVAYSYLNGNFDPVANPAAVQTGIYQIIATNLTGCSDTVAVTITDNVKPVLGADTSVYHTCPGEFTNLLPLYTTTGLTAVWNTGNPSSVAPGTYRLVVTNNFGCTDTAFANVILETAVWKGTVSNNWHTEGNWSTNLVPSERTHVIIPAATPNICVIKNADGIAASIQVKTGATMQIINSHKLDIKGKCNTLPAN